MGESGGAKNVHNQTRGWGATAVAELAGPNLRLQPLTPADFEEYRDVVAHNLEALREAGVGERARAKSASQEAFEAAWRDEESLREQGSLLNFGIFAGDELIGEIALHGLEWGDIRSATMSAWLDHDKVGDDLAREACLVLIRHAFEDLDLHRVQAAVDPENASAVRSLERAGIRREGVLKNYRKINGEYRDNALYAVTREEFAELMQSSF